MFTRLEEEQLGLLSNLRPQEQFSQFMKNLPAAAWVKDLQGRYMYANPEAERIFGVPLSQLLGKTDEQLFPGTTAEQFQENDKLAREQNIQTTETLVQPDSITHTSVVSKFPIKNAHGKTILVGGVAIDVTDKLQAEKELQKAIAQRDSFLSIASHELKTPITSVKAFLQALEQRMKTPEQFDFQKNSEYMRLSIRQVDRLAAIINNLLDVKKIADGKMEYSFTVMPIGGVISDVVERMAVSFPQHRMVVKLQNLSIHASIDVLRFEQVLTNLIANAVKYSLAGSTIEIAMIADEQVHVSVSDQGIGISEEQQRHIFDQYYRTPEAITTRAGGLGIGLYIALEIMKMHKGSISVSSQPGKGSTFTLHLPIKTSQQP